MLALNELAQIEEIAQMQEHRAWHGLIYSTFRGRGRAGGKISPC